MEGRALLAVPRGLKGLSPLTLDMTVIYAAENELAGVSRATPINWLTLASQFNVAYNQANKYRAYLRAEKNLALKEARMAKKELTVDRLSSWLKEKGLKDSIDAREALYLSDKNYVEAMDRVGALEAAIEFLDAKAKSFVQAYQAVKKVADDRTMGYTGNLRGEGEDIK